MHPERLLVTAITAMSVVSPAAGQWVDTLPIELQESILWFGDHEEGNLDDWDYGNDPAAGGCICNTGGPVVSGEIQAIAEVTDLLSHSGQYSARTTIKNAYRAENGNRGVRLMRWTDKHWAEGGEYFPTESYYSTWVYVPTTYNPNKYDPWDPGDGGWFIIFQFKSQDETCGLSRPVWTLNIEHDDDTEEMKLRLYTAYTPPNSFDQDDVALPIGQWIHLEAFYRISDDFDGRITIWQDGEVILDIDNAITSLGGNPPECDGHSIWGIGNYTDHVVGGPIDGAATLLFDDSAVSTRRLSAALVAPSGAEDR